jgi:hypothetical protein
MIRTCSAATLAAALALTTTLGAQDRNGKRPVLSGAAEMALARSAAPAAVSNGARTWTWDGTKYVVGDSGRTVVNCYVGRPWAGATEPHCFDQEGSATIMPIMMRRVELYAQGMKETEVEREIAAGLLAGTFRLPQRAAVTYMMSAVQELVTEQGNAVGAWQPHLMIYMPFVTAQQLGIPGNVPDLGFVENPGKALAALIVPLKTFVAAPKVGR